MMGTQQQVNIIAIFILKRTCDVFILFLFIDISQALAARSSRYLQERLHKTSKRARGQSTLFRLLTFYGGLRIYLQL
jgi:hypothetical protein